MIDANDSIAGSFVTGTADAAAAEQLQRMTQQRRDVENTNETLVPMPGGTLARLAEIIDHDYVP